MALNSILQQQAARKQAAELKTMAEAIVPSDTTTGETLPEQVKNTDPNPNANETGGSNAVKQAKEDAASPESSDKDPEPPADGYKNVGLNQYMKADGSVVKPDANGYFVPKTQEEFDMLEHYADRNELVNRPVTE